MAGRDDKPAQTSEPLWAAENFIAWLVGGLYSCGSAIATVAERQTQREALEHELNALDDRQLSDLGITREQVPVVVGAYPLSAELLTRMLARLGITEEAIACNPGLRRQLERTCSFCFLRRECKRYLRLPADASPDGYRTFCPNAAKLDELRPRSGTCE
ncbi:MAG: DUF1127 domain-containing protein [Rhodospirillaceae bacterium]|nr:DUF1127 domain-containing protein [Rhodospirillaceae bacterium]